MNDANATPEQIKIIENRIKYIFNKDRITRLDVIIAKELIEDWIVITNHTPNNDNNNIVDEEPIWKI